MIAKEEALQKILSAVFTVGAESVPLCDAAGRVLAEDLPACADSPPFDNSAMDGYAVRAEDLSSASAERPATLRLAGRVEAGAGSVETLRPGEAARIFTGAQLPAGADAVVRQEIVEVEGEKVRFFEKVAPGEDLRAAGEDFRTGDLVLPRGRRLGPLEIALLASQGMSRVRVARRPRVCVVSTGNELVPAESPLAPGKIRNSNGPCLRAALDRTGTEVTDLGIVRDHPDALRAEFRRGLTGSDMLVVSGGVSVGDRDHTREVLESLGFGAVFWKVAVKPGKPLLFGMCGPAVVFGLPGNPVSSWMSFELFVRPALERMMDMHPRDPWHLRGRALNEYPGAGPRQLYLFCRTRSKGGDFSLEIMRPQGSAMIGMAVQADAIAIVPAGGHGVRPGDSLAFRMIR